MSIGQTLLQEMNQELAVTRRVLERVPMDRFDWKPHEKSFSMGELANHTSHLLNWGKVTMTTESLDLEPPGGELEGPEVARTGGELLAAFDGFLEDFLGVVEGADDEAFMTPWTLLKGGVPIITLPRVAVIRNMILNHLIHHRGQLTVYLRLNDVAVPAVYGPSADEEA